MSKLAKGWPLLAAALAAIAVQQAAPAYEYHWYSNGDLRRADRQEWRAERRFYNHAYSISPYNTMYPGAYYGQPVITPFRHYMYNF